MSFSPEFDAIQELRRADDPTLDQGEWELGALRGNPAVTKITVIDPATLAERVILQR